jgi:hypothetical protein
MALRLPTCISIFPVTVVKMMMMMMMMMILIILILLIIIIIVVVFNAEALEGVRLTF